MKILIEVPDDYEPEEGDAFDAVRDALEFSNIPSSLMVITDPIHPESTIDVGASATALEDDDFEVAVPKYLQLTSNMSTDELDDWYEKHVGYRVSDDDPSLVGSPEHGYMVAEMMCLHANGEGHAYQNLLLRIDNLRSGRPESAVVQYCKAPPNILNRLKPVPNKSIGADFSTATRLLQYPYFEISMDEYNAVTTMAGSSNTDILLLDGCLQVTFGQTGNKTALMPLSMPM